jgi:hypothetical protein
MARNAAMVAKLSSPRRNPLTVVTPLAIAPSIIERCEMDLSPGTPISPFREVVGLMVIEFTNNSVNTVV